MFLSETLIWLIEHGWLVFLHLSARSSFPKPLTPEEEKRFIEELACGSAEAERRLIEHNLRLVAHIAKKYARSCSDADDLISIGSIGLMKAVHTFKPEAGKLTTYASRCIENEILMYLRKCQPLKNEVSIEEPLNTDWDGNELLLSDVLGTDPDSINRPIEQESEKMMLSDAIERLEDREKTIMKLRFGLKDGNEYTQKQVADMIGISQSYISRLEKRIIRRLRRDLEKVI